MAIVKTDNHNWFIYLLECSDRSLYCGITNNISKRLLAHNKGVGSKYTRTRLPVTLKCISKQGYNKSIASKIEYAIKQHDKKDKIKALENCEKLLQQLKRR